MLVRPQDANRRIPGGVDLGVTDGKESAPSPGTAGTGARPRRRDKGWFLFAAESRSAR